MARKATLAGNQASLLDPEMVQYVKDSGRLSDLAYQAILNAITTGRLKAGKQIREEALTKELQISRATVRSALSRLVVEGLLVDEPFKGVRVLAIRPQDVKEVFELRSLLEGHAMELAADRISAEALSQMRALLPETVVTKGIDQVGVVRDRNREFHWIAIRACEQQLLIRYLKLLWGFMAAYVFIDEMTPVQLHDAANIDLEFHQALLDALSARDGAKARDVVIAETESTLSGILKHVLGAERAREGGPIG